MTKSYDEEKFRESQKAVLVFVIVLIYITVSGPCFELYEKCEWCEAFGRLCCRILDCRRQFCTVYC